MLAVVREDMDICAATQANDTAEASAPGPLSARLARGVHDVQTRLRAALAGGE
jgi:hypothetical protein